MKTKFFIAMLFFGSAVFFLSGCQKAPQSEIDSAKSAVESAKSAEVDKYLAEEFQAIQDSLNVALAAIEEQNAKGSMGRKYDEPKQLLNKVTEMANNAVGNVQKRKTELKAQNEMLVVELKTLIEENKVLLAKAPKGKDGKAALDMISQDLTVIELTVTEATNLNSSGDILSAYDKLSASKIKANSIKSELTQAIDKTKGLR